ncbi:MAG: zinc-ribbon domain-containing protein [Methylophilaceae bacterium]|nr:zinc-ribbon domain-containing protein [Methylophilaceae bacterium]
MNSLGPVPYSDTFDLDAELKIWVSGTQTPIQKEFNSQLNIFEVQSVFASYVLGYDSSEGLIRQDKDEDTNAIAAPTSTSQDESSELDFCFHCGEQVKANAKKCPSCGGML